jgi:hypothetical protein
MSAMINTAQLISRLLSQNGARGFAGSLFEQAAHYTFRAGHRLKPRHLIDKASFTIDIPKVDDEADGYYHTLAVWAKPGSRDVSTQYLKRYMIPISKREESIDSIWISKDVTVLFQITVSPNHPLKYRGLFETINSLPANAKKSILIVFLVPAGDEQTKNFKRQPIDFPAGTAEKEVEEANALAQYVYYLKVRL